MPSSNTPLLNLSLLIDVTFSTPTPVNNTYALEISETDSTILNREVFR